MRLSKNNMFKGLVAAMAIVMLLSVQIVFAKDNPKKHWATQFHQDLLAALTPQDENMPGPVKFVFGNNIWQPGKQFNDGKDWLALTCTGHECKFEEATLVVKRKSWQGQYDDKATPGQQLRFNTVATSRRKVIAWFNTASAPAWLKPGNIPSYYTGVGQPRQTGKGTFEALIALPDGGNASLVPMLLSERYAPDLRRKYDDGGTAFALFLQLRSHGKRQLLLGELGACGHTVNGLSYLLWAGDLDGDGKPDYLISFIDDDGPVQLYLSSAAATGQLVGLAGVHSAPPYGGECDGGGWEL